MAASRTSAALATDVEIFVARAVLAPPKALCKVAKGVPLVLVGRA